MSSADTKTWTTSEASDKAPTPWQAHGEARDFTFSAEVDVSNYGGWSLIIDADVLSGVEFHLEPALTSTGCRVRYYVRINRHKLYLDDHAGLWLPHALSPGSLYFGVEGSGVHESSDLRGVYRLAYSFHIHRYGFSGLHDAPLCLQLSDKLYARVYMGRCTFSPQPFSPGVRHPTYDIVASAANPISEQSPVKEALRRFARTNDVGQVLVRTGR